MSTAAGPPRHIAPMLARAGTLPEHPERWCFEVKWDGVRALAHVDAEGLRLESRNLNAITASYPELSPPPPVLAGHSGTVLDGEIIATDATGRPSFGRLQQRMHVGAPSARLLAEVPVSYVVFDLLWLDGEDLTALPYAQRRERLEALGLSAGAWRVPAVHPGQGAELLAATRERGLEGIVAKALDSPYRPGGRTGAWLKLKHSLAQELVIGGWLPGEGRRRERIGALLMGHYADGRLIYAGRVGTGFSDATLAELQRRLAPLVQAASPFDPPPRLPAHAVYVAPVLVAEVAFSEWTREGIMRAPSFKGLRSDKAAREVVREPLDAAASPPGAGESPPGAGESPPDAGESPPDAAESPPGAADSPRVPADRPGAAGSPTPGQAPPAGPGATRSGVTRPGARNGELEYAGRTLTISNHAKVLYPETGFTKGDVIDYYAAVAPAVLGHLRDRALTLKRYPNGVEQPFFYEKNSPAHRPAWVPTAEIGGVGYTLAQEPATLVWLANLADLELHTSLALAAAPQSPTVLAFDLDPGPPAGLLECAEVALVIRALFAQFGLVSCVKTSGNKGLQVYVPLNDPAITYADTKPLARQVAELLEARMPERVVAQMTKSRRTGRVFVDWSQNDLHKTTVTVYSLRATPAPSVSTPLEWAEIEAARTADDATRLRFGPAQVLARIAAQGDLFAPVLNVTQTLPALR